MFVYLSACSRGQAKWESRDLADAFRIGRNYTIIGQINKILSRFLSMLRYIHEDIFIVSKMCYFKYTGPFSEDQAW